MVATDKPTASTWCCVGVFFQDISSYIPSKVSYGEAGAISRSMGKSRPNRLVWGVLTLGLELQHETVLCLKVVAPARVWLLKGWPQPVDGWVEPISQFQAHRY